MREPIVRWIEQGAVHEHRSPDPFDFATALAARLGGAPAGLEIVRPSLEDIYLGLVAEASLEDAAEPVAFAPEVTR